MRADRRMFVPIEARENLKDRADAELHRNVGADEDRTLHERRPRPLRAPFVRRRFGATRYCFIGIPVHDVVVQNARPVRALDGRIGRSAGQVGVRTGVRRFTWVVRRSGLHG